MEKLYAIIPAYNEQDNIRKVIRDWYDVIAATGPESRLVVIDDGSRDDTFKIMQEEAADKPALIALHKDNSGHGATILFGYRYALENGASFIFQTDSDGQTLPSEFDLFYKRRYEYEYLIGHRKNRQDGFFRIVTNRVLRYVVRAVFSIDLKDINTPYRLMTAPLLEDCLRYIPNDFNLSNVLLTVVAARRGYTGLYIPVTFRNRQGGKNSINVKKIFKIGIKALKDFTAVNKSLEN
ncbi:MAG: glycosyltransferase family 2 protein [Lachnospiraceae bacterium]|nr:glycosyltransferase family 2 protein [Lachnospiraceae bacterium]